MEAFCHLSSSKILFGSGRMVIWNKSMTFGSLAMVDPRFFVRWICLPIVFSFVYGGPWVSADVDVCMSWHTSISSHWFCRACLAVLSVKCFTCVKRPIRTKSHKGCVGVRSDSTDFILKSRCAMNQAKNIVSMECTSIRKFIGLVVLFCPFALSSTLAHRGCSRPLKLYIAPASARRRW